MRKLLKRTSEILLVVVMTVGIALLGGFVGPDLPDIGSIFAPKAEAASYSGSCGENLNWSFDTSTGTLTISGTGAMDDYSHTNGIMPPWYDYYENIYFVSLPNGLSNISGHAFQNTKITSIVIPDGVTEIGYMSFYSCENLESVTISNTVTKLGYYCFENCKNLKNIRIPASITSIGTDSFRGCDGIISFEVDSANEYFSNDNYGVLFNKSKTRMIKYPVGSTSTVYEIPDSVNNISSNAFENCMSLVKIDIPYGITILNSNVFMRCAALENIVIPNSVTKIYSQAIQDCTNLEYVHIPASVTTIGYNFSGTHAYICSDTEDCYAKEYADANSIKFVLCEGHEVHTHSYTSSVTTEPTCTKDGVITYICECGNSYTEVIPAAGHSAGDWETVTEPTITTEGEMVRTCGICGEVTDRKEIPPIAEYTITFYVNGVSVHTVSYQECETIDFNNIPDDSCVTVEGYTFKGWYDESDNAFGHYTTMPDENLEYQAVFTANTYTITINANGGEFFDGSEIKTYEVAYGTVIEFPEDPTREGCCFLGYNPAGIPTTMPAMDMTFTAVWEEIEIEHTHTPKTVTIPASCTDAGAEYQICDECGEPIGEATVIPALGHTAGEWKIITDATCTADGTKVKKCIACGETVETGSVPATGHSAGDWETVLEPTITSNGKKVVKCTVCGEVLDEEVIPMLRTVTVTDDESGISLTYPEDDYSGNVDVVVEKSFDGAAFNLVDTKTNAVQTFIYDITMTIDGVETQPSGKITVRIPLPEGYNPARTYVYHVDTSTGKVEKLPAEYVSGYMVFETDHFSYYALVEEYVVTLDIRIPSTTSISYGDSIVLYADLSESLPNGWYIEWTSSNGNFSYSVSDDGTTCTISPSSSGDTKFTIKVVTADGEVIAEDTQVMTSKAGLFDKIIGFFKKLFGLTKTIPQVFRIVK